MLTILVGPSFADYFRIRDFVEKGSMNGTYKSELIASTDIHAGGHFFGYVFRRVIQFSGKSVILTKEMADVTDHMDMDDVEYLKSYKIVGNYEVDGDRIICNFDSIFLRMTGIKSNKMEGLMVFHCFDSRLNRQWGDVFHLA